MSKHALTEQERKIFWTYYNGGRRIIPVMTYFALSAEDAHDALEQIELKLLRQAQRSLVIYCEACPQGTSVS